MKSESLVDVYESMFSIVGDFTTHRIMFAAGERIGRTMVKNRTINDPRILMDVLKDHMEKEGLGDISYESVLPRNDPASNYPVEMKVKIYNSPLTELKSKGIPQCSFIRGILRGAYCEFKDWRDVSVTEVKCVAVESDYCEFEIKKGPGNY
ncbi:MAG: V4R domain-containing protein [Candidatus Micrarchaeota archaeon]